MLLEKFYENINVLPLIKGDYAKKFIEEFNANIVSKDYLEKCERVGQLFSRNR